jgi:hypothetical protein
VTSTVCNVRDNFPGVPSRSIEFAQAFVDEALKLPGVRAFRNRGIGFKPNFVFVEYLREAGRGGAMLSFYGGPDRHRNPQLKAGRTDSYRRASVHTAQELPHRAKKWLAPRYSASSPALFHCSLPITWIRRLEGCQIEPNSFRVCRNSFLIGFLIG